MVDTRHQGAGVLISISVSWWNLNYSLWVKGQSVSKDEFFILILASFVANWKTLTDISQILNVLIQASSEVRCELCTLHKICYLYSLANTWISHLQWLWVNHNIAYQTVVLAIIWQLLKIHKVQITLATYHRSPSAQIKYLSRLTYLLLVEQLKSKLFISA